MIRHLLIATFCLGAFALGTARADPLPEPVAAGSRLHHSLCEQYVNGSSAGTNRSLICDLAGRPAVIVYARELDPTVVNLVKKLDAVSQCGWEQKMKSSCVLLTTRDADLDSLKALAKEEKLDGTILAATPVQTERPYFGSPALNNVHKEAAVTVLVLQGLTVKSSYSLRAGELNDDRINEIVKAAAGLLPPLKK